MKRTILSVLALVGACVGLVACEGSGSATVKGRGQILGATVDVNANIHYGKGQDQLPPGATLQGYILIGGQRVEVYKDAQGVQYLKFPGSDDYNPVTGGTITINGVKQPVTAPASTSQQNGSIVDGESSSGYAQRADGTIDLGVGYFAFDEDTTGLAALQFWLPTGAHLTDPSAPTYGPDIAVTLQTTAISTGYSIQVQGTIDEVMRYALAQGISSFTTQIDGLGRVEATINLNYGVVIFTQNGHTVPAAFRPVRPIITPN